MLTHSSMEKDFQPWCKKKRDIHESTSCPLFKEREVWWCSVGTNVQHEIDGKGVEFSRPVLIVRRYNSDTFLGLPITSKAKSNYWVVPIGEHGVKMQNGIASQVRTLSAARLTRRLFTITDPNFQVLKAALREKLI